MQLLYARILVRLRDKITTLVHGDGCEKKDRCFTKGKCKFEVNSEFFDKSFTLDDLSIDNKFLVASEERFTCTDWYMELLFLQYIRYENKTVLFSVCHDEASTLVDNLVNDTFLEKNLPGKGKISTFRLIRRALFMPFPFYVDSKKYWWPCPFIFSDTF